MPPELKGLPGSVKVTEGKKSSKSEIKVILVTGTAVKDYNTAKKVIEDSTAVINRLYPTLQKSGLDYIFTTNVGKPEDPVTSVKLQDATGETLRVSFTAKYNGCNKEQVVDVLGSIKGVDINDCVVETLGAKFDAKVFLDKEGDFAKKKYDKYLAAIEKVAKELGDECPLSCFPVLSPKADFHDKRWTTFTLAQQYDVTRVLPNTISLTPVRI